MKPAKKYGGWWRWALVSPHGVAPSRMVSVSASVNLPLHHKVQKFSFGTSHPGGPRKWAVKRLSCGKSEHNAEMDKNSHFDCSKQAAYRSYPNAIVSDRKATIV